MSTGPNPWVAALLALPAAAGGVPGSEFVRVEGARFESVLPVDVDALHAEVGPFWLQRAPVTNAQFERFVIQHPAWARGSAPALFVDASYLRDWEAPAKAGSKARPEQPVVHVSWFAATAYCEAQGARLPTWHEWEWAAAADERVADARKDPAWRQRMLNWYAETGGHDLRAVAQGKPNMHGLHDLHGLVWEWVEDYGALMVSGDNREQGDPDLTKFCGTGALSMEQKENYAVLMRIAMLSSLEARYTTANLGFRCAKDAPGLSR